MTLAWEQTKQLMRMQGVAEELLFAARNASAGGGRPGGTTPLEAVRAQIGAVVEQVRRVLEASDPALTEEFTEVLTSSSGVYGAEAQAAALFGWLKGVVAAESFEARIKEDARAYAEERVRQERPVGFSSSV